MSVKGDCERIDRETVLDFLASQRTALVPAEALNERFGLQGVIEAIRLTPRSLTGWITDGAYHFILTPLEAERRGLTLSDDREPRWIGRGEAKTRRDGVRPDPDDEATDGAELVIDPSPGPGDEECEVEARDVTTLDDGGYRRFEPQTTADKRRRERDLVIAAAATVAGISHRMLGRVFKMPHGRIGAIIAALALEFGELRDQLRNSQPTHLEAAYDESAKRRVPRHEPDY